MSDDLDTRRKDPPTEKEWPGIWEAIDRAEKMWPIVGPIHAAVTNWRAWVAIAALVAYIRGEEIIAAILKIRGGL